jgi:O-antigen/teichoic acid export membrane protein
MKRAFTWIVGRLRSHRTALAAVFAMGIKGSGALLTIAIFTLAARAMSADEFGQLAVWFNVMGFLGIAAVFGQDTLIARSWGEYNGRGQSEAAHGAYRFGWRMTIISGAVFVFGLLVIAPMTTMKIAPAALYAAAAFLFAQTMLHYSSHSSRVVVGFVVSETNRELTWRLVLLLAVVWAALHQGLTPVEFFGAGATGMVLSLVVQLRAVRRKFAAEPIARVRETDSPAWFARSRAMWLSAIVEAASLYADVMLIGYFASPAVAGEYFVAARIANIFLMVNTGLNTYTFQHSASLYFSGQIHRLQDILRSLASVALAFLLPALIVIVIFGKLILTIFGAHYAADYPALIVLTTGTFLISLCGSASVILLTTGHEKLYSRVAMGATVARILLTAALASQFGALGAACGWTLVNAPLAMVLAVVCRAVCGVDPSALAIFRRRAATPSAPLAPASGQAVRGL